MVKFADGPPFQDAYLSSLRTNDGLFDSPSPKVAARKPRATSKPASGAPAGPTAAKHASPILQRAAARREERLAFLHSCGPGGRQLERELHEKERKEKELGHPAEHPSQRTQQLWDLSAPVEVPEQRDDFSDISDSNAGAVWDAARVRREMRKDMAKQAQSDLEEIEQLAAGMRKRAQRYGPMKTKEDEMRAEDAENRDEDCAEGSNKYGDVGPKVNGGAVLVRAMDDGYGGRVAGRAGQQKHAHDGSVESFVHKFQTARIRHHPTTREDELMTDESSATLSKREQTPRKAIPYRGINEEEDGEEYLATSNTNAYDRSAYAASSPVNARLQRIREMRSQPQARDDAPEPSNIGTEEKERTPAKNATSWYEERKRQQQDGISSGSDRLESWWRVQRGSREGVRDGGTNEAKPFEELVDEPTVDDATPALAQKKKCAGEEKEPAVMSKPPLSPVPHARRAGKGERGDDAHASPSLAAFRARLAKYETGHGGDRAGQSPAVGRRTASRPSPETPVGSVVVPARHPCHDTPQSAGASVLSDADEASRCHSVAQSTLAVLLARLEEARTNFNRALEEGDVARQVELAGLMSRLGEAAVTMRKLEQV